MSLFDYNSTDNKSSQQSNQHSQDPISMFHPIDDTKKLMAEVAGIVRDIRKMVDKASRAMKIMGE